MKSIKDLNLNNKKVLIRVDYNVPIKNGIILDDFRIKSSLSTINYCINEGASIILASHLGRPNGEYNSLLSLDPIAFRLEELIKKDILFSEDCISDEAIELSSQLQKGEIHLLENLRFHKGEKLNDEIFSWNLSRHADIFINDAFGTAHRSHSSNLGILKYVNMYCPGFLLEKEFKYLHTKLKKNNNPFVLILGGSKIIGKIELIENMLSKVNKILIGGFMSFPFLKVKGYDVTVKNITNESLIMAENILTKAKINNVEIILPKDFVFGDSPSDPANLEILTIDKSKKINRGYDIGPESVLTFSNAILNSNTILWNGPLGITEIPEYSTGTDALASEIKDLTKKGCLTIIGGGDTASALKNQFKENSFSHVSTGGGASLELLTNKKLPALKALNFYE